MWRRIITGGLLAAFGWLGLDGCGRPVDRCCWVESVPVVLAVEEDVNAKDRRDETPIQKAEMRSTPAWLREEREKSAGDRSAEARAIRDRLDTVVLQEDFDDLPFAYFLDEAERLGGFRVIRNVAPDILNMGMYLPVEGWTLYQALLKVEDLVPGFSYDVRNGALVVTVE